MWQHNKTVNLSFTLRSMVGLKPVHLQWATLPASTPQCMVKCSGVGIALVLAAQHG